MNLINNENVDELKLELKYKYGTYRLKL